MFCGPELDDKLLTSLLQRNANGMTDLPRLGPVDGVTFIERAETPRHAAGTYFLSFPGLSPDRSRALVHVIWTNGPLAIENSFVQLARRGNGWMVSGVCDDWGS
jgi:hypothetical protein